MQLLNKTAAFLAAGLMTISTAQAGGVSDDEVLIGAHTPLSGPAAIWGVASTGAAQIRFDEANNSGGVHGRQIRMIVEDSQYQVPLSVKAVNKLIQRDKVFAIFGSLGTAHNLSTKDRIFGQGVPLLFPFTTARSLQEPTEHLKITWGSSYHAQSRAAVTYLHKEKGRNSICVMYQDTDYGTEVLAGVEEVAAELGLDIVAAVGHKPTATEFVGTLSGFKSAGCDMIIMGTIIRDTIIGYATARKLGIEADIAAPLPAADTIVSGVEGGVTEGLYSFSATEVAYADNAPETAKPFFDAYRAKFEKEPGTAAILGYVWADLLVTALENAGTDLTADALIAGFEAIKDYQDPFGNPAFSYSAEDHNGSNAVIPLQVQGGRWVTLDQ
jgi:branched-chain amino acid transport system substrate-binding protein